VRTPPAAGSPERRQIAEWLASGVGGLLVVTGDPRAGKSALLAEAAERAAPVNAEGWTADQIAEALGRGVFAGDWDAPRHAEAAPVERLLALTEGAGRPVLFAVDNLDRAEDPYGVAVDLLAPLARTKGAAVLVGSRRAVESRLGVPDNPDAPLVKALGPGLRIDLPPGPAAVDNSLAQAQGADAAVLQAAALAQGKGVPVDDGVWLAMARALADSDVTAGDLENALRRHGQALLTRDLDFGQEVWRPASPEIRDAITQSRLGGARAAHASIARALAQLAWSQLAADAVLNPYIARHLPAHCALGGGTPWLEVERRAPILDHLDFERVRAAVASAGFGDGAVPANVAAVASATRWLEELESPAERALIREAEAWRHPRSAAPPPFATPAGGVRVAVDWAVPKAARFERALPVVTGVLALACFEDAGGAWRLAVGGTDGTVRIWDPETGRPLGDPMVGHTQAVLAMTLVGGTILATAGDDRTVRLWDLAGRRPLGVLLKLARGLVKSLAVVSAGGRTLLACGCSDGAVRLADPATGTLFGSGIAAGQGRVLAMATVPVHGRERLAVAYADATVRLWDLAAGQAAADGIVNFDGPVHALRTVQWGGRALLACGGSDGSVRLVDPATGQTVRFGQGDRQAVLALAPIRVGEREALAVGGRGGSVWLWDLATEERLTPDLTWLDGWVQVLEPVRAGGRSLLATGGNRRTLRLWDPAQDPPDHDGQTIGLVARMAAVNTLVATANYGSELRVWNTEARVAAGNIRPWSTDGPSSLAEAHVQGRTTLAVGGYGGLVQFWDLAAGRCLAELETAAGATVGAMAELDLGGRRVLAIASGHEGAVQLWDVAAPVCVAATQAGEWRQVKGLFGATVQGRTVVGIVHDWEVSTWDPTSGAPPSSLGELRMDRLTAAAPVRVGGRELLATGNQSGRVQLWNLLGRVCVAESSAGHPREVRSVATVPVGDRCLLATISYDTSVRLWDPGAGLAEPVAVIPLAGSPQCLSVPGPGLIAVGSDGGLAVFAVSAGRPAPASPR
jgi:WD40 repeat protein